MYQLRLPPSFSWRHVLRVWCLLVSITVLSNILVVVYTHRALYIFSAMRSWDLHAFWALAAVPMISFAAMIYLLKGCNDEIFQPCMVQYLWKLAHRTATTTHYAQIAPALQSNHKAKFLGITEINPNERISLLLIKLLISATAWRSVTGFANHIRAHPAFLENVNDEGIKTAVEWLLRTGGINNEEMCLKLPAFQMLVVQRVLLEQNLTKQSHRDQADRVTALLKELNLLRKSLDVQTTKLITVTKERHRAVENTERVNTDLVLVKRLNKDLESKVLALQSGIEQIEDESISTKRDLEDQLTVAIQSAENLKARSDALNKEMYENKKERTNLESEIERLVGKSQNLLNQLASTTKSQAQLRRNLAAYENALPHFQKHLRDVRQAHVAVIEPMMAAFKVAQEEITELKALVELSDRVDATVIHLLLHPEEAVTRSEQEVRGMLENVIDSLARTSALKVVNMVNSKNKIVGFEQRQGGSQPEDRYQLQLLQPWRTHAQSSRQVKVNALQALTTTSRIPQLQGRDRTVSQDAKHQVVSIHNEHKLPSEVSGPGQRTSWLPGLGEPPAFARRIASDGNNSTISVSHGKVQADFSMSPAHVWRSATGLPASRSSTPVPGQGKH